MNSRPSESVERVGQASRIPESHGRTDGRTDEEATDVTASLTSATCAGGAEPFNIAAVIERVLERATTGPERHPVVRTGPRDEIPWDLRRAVYRRDGWRCRTCGCTYTDDRLELDHALPWSAGGEDVSTNLRTLCHWCNTQRSNWRDGAENRRLLPVTWWCAECHGIPSDPEDPDQRRHSWRQRPPQVRPAPPLMDRERATTFAYCAWCDINSYTEVTL